MLLHGAQPLQNLLCHAIRCVACHGPDQGRFGPCQRLQFQWCEAYDTPRAVPRIHQAADGAKALDLVRRVAPVPRTITPRLGKAVAALPDAQRVLGQTGVALDRCNRIKLLLCAGFVWCHGMGFSRWAGRQQQYTVGTFLRFVGACTIGQIVLKS